MPKTHVLEQQDSTKITTTTTSTSSSKETSSSSSSSSEPSINVNIKSLKLPFKFSVTISIAGSETVYSLKNKLIQTQLKSSSLSSSSEGKEETIITPGNIKLLKKGKVISDSKTIVEILDSPSSSTEKSTTEVNLVAMVSVTSTGTNSSIVNDNNNTNTSTSASTSNNNNSELSENIWEAIQSVVSSRLGSSESSKIVKRLRKGWDLTSPTNNNNISNLD